MSGDSMLQKIRDEFFGNSLTMIDFLGQFELMAQKYFEPGRIYDLYRLCLVKRLVLDGGEREVLQFLNDRLELIEELTLGKKSSEQLVVNEFLSFGESDGSGSEPEVAPLMQDFFDRVISVSSSESITRRTVGLSKILLDGETRTETYTDRPDIPLFEESEDGYQKVHPVSKAFKEDEDIPLIAPFSEEPDLFSDLGLHPEKEEDKDERENLPLNDEPEVLFTHSSIVIDDSDDEEEEYTVFEGGMKVTAPDEEEVIARETDEESLEEFIESLVEESHVEEPEVETEPSFESEEIPGEMSVPGEELPADDLPGYEPVTGSDHFELVDEVTEEPTEVTEVTEKLPEEPEIAEDQADIPEITGEFEESVEMAETAGDAEEPIEVIESVEEFEEPEEMAESADSEEIPEIPEPEPPHRKQRISIFDDFDEEPQPEPVAEPSEPEHAEEVLQDLTEEIEPEHESEIQPEPLPMEAEPEVETEPDYEAEPVLLTEDDLILPEDQEEVSEEIEEVVTTEVADTLSEEITEPEETEETAEVASEEIKETVTEENEETVTAEPEEIEPEKEVPVLFDEHFFDEVVETESEKVESVDSSEPEEVFHHISRDEIISPQADTVTETEEIPTHQTTISVAVDAVEQPVAEINAGTKEEEQTMAAEAEKSTFSVLIKMLIVLGLIIATWFILDATGLLKGKAAAINGVDLAKGAVVITDSNSLADNREYPFNRDTQNDGNLKGTIFKDGKYYEVAENGVLTPVDYDTSSSKKIKVTVPPDSLLVKDAKKDKKGDKKEKGKDKEKTAGSGNITLQDAVKNKVKETKIADHVFKSGKKFFVQISAHRSFDTAEKIALDLKKKGYNSFVMKVKKDGVRGEDGVWYRVRIGPYDKEAKALEVNKVFNKNKKS